MNDLVWYFFKLGSVGFGGPAALVGYMRRDLVDDRQLIDEPTYNLSIALAQIMPGPLAAQTAMAIGYFQGGVAGATLVGLAFILPSFLMVLGLSAVYVAYGGMPWMQSVFYGIGAVVIAIISVAAYRLARGTNKSDPLLWTVFAVMLLATAWTGTELATLCLVAGLLVLLVRAWPGVRQAGLLAVAGLAAVALILVLERELSTSTASGDQHVLMQILLFFTKAGSFVFGSGLAIVPFLHAGVVQEYGWLNDKQFLDAVAVAMLTPGPIVITVAFIGYLVAAFPGAVAAAVGVFLPVYLFVVVPFPWFDRISGNARVKGFVAGVTAAASGTIAGACVVLARRAIVDVPTLLIAAAALVVAWRFKIPEPVLIAAGALAGLIIFAVR